MLTRLRRMCRPAFATTGVVPENGEPTVERRRIVVLLSEISTHGGMQRFNRVLCKALSDYETKRGVRVEILSLNDPRQWYDERYLTRPVIGCERSRDRFVLEALRALAKPHDLAVVGQIDLAPLVVPSHLVFPRARSLLVTHGIEVWSRLPWFKRAALHTMDRVWAVSAYTADRLVRVQGVASARLQVVPNILDPEFIANMTLWNTGGNEVIRSPLLTISRMSTRDKEKGIDHVIASLPLVRLRVPDVSYAIVGDGDDRLRLEQLARDHRVADIVHFVGQVSEQELHAYLSGASVIILPSKKEGFGIIFLEAMAYRKPVIAGAHGGIPEVVVDGKTGVLVKYGDQSALVSAVTDMLLSPDARVAMGEAGFQRVQSTFTYQRFQTTVTQTLDELLSSSLPASAPGATRRKARSR